MSELQKAKAVYKLSEAKEEILNRIELIENNKHDTIHYLKLDGFAERSFDRGNYERWFNGKRLYTKVKYLLIAELKETLDEIQNEIDKLVVFKEENKDAQ